MIDDFDIRVREHLAEFVQARIAQLGLKKSDVARALGENDSKIGKICQGLHTPSLAYAIQLAVVLECELSELEPPKIESTLDQLNSGSTKPSRAPITKPPSSEPTFSGENVEPRSKPRRRSAVTS